jgi:hypothetical protein
MSRVQPLPLPKGPQKPPSLPSPEPGSSARSQSPDAQSWSRLHSDPAGCTPHEPTAHTPELHSTSRLQPTPSGCGPHLVAKVAQVPDWHWASAVHPTPFGCLPHVPTSGWLVSTPVSAQIPDTQSASTSQGWPSGCGPHPSLLVQLPPPVPQSPPSHGEPGPTLGLPEPQPAASIAARRSGGTEATRSHVERMKDLLAKPVQQHRGRCEERDVAHSAPATHPRTSEIETAVVLSPGQPAVIKAAGESAPPPRAPRAPAPRR